MIYEEKEKNEYQYVSINTVARGLILPRKQSDSIGESPFYPTKEQKPTESLIKHNEVSQHKEEQSMEGIGDYEANSKTEPISSPYQKFVSKVNELKREKQQKADMFWSMKGIEVPSLSVTNINHRNTLAQKVGGSANAIIQSSLLVIGYDLGNYGPNKNGVDGHIGPVTKKAIQEFQRTIGLNPTGKIDEQTMIALEVTVEAGLDKNDLDKLSVTLGITPTWLEVAKKQLGKPYGWDESKNQYPDPPNSFDCSSFVSWVYYYGFNKKLSRRVESIYKETFKVNEPKPGMLIVFHGTYDSNYNGKIDVNDKSHIGIWLGNNEFIHASSSKGVIISNFSAYYKSIFDSFRAVPGIKY